MIKFCQYCKDHKIIHLNDECGYYWSYLDSVTTCNECGGPLIDIDFPNDELKVLSYTSSDTDFIEAMMELKKRDIIEYNVKMSQFKTQLAQQDGAEAQQKRLEAENYPGPKCPTCNSTNIARIPSITKAVDGALFGIYGTKWYRTFHCNHCGYEW